MGSKDIFLAWWGGFWLGVIALEGFLFIIGYHS